MKVSKERRLRWRRFVPILPRDCEECEARFWLEVGYRRIDPERGSLFAHFEVLCRTCYIDEDAHADD